MECPMSGAKSMESMQDGLKIHPSSTLPENLDIRGDEFPYLVSPTLCPNQSARPATHGKKWSKTLFPDANSIKKFKLRFIPPVNRDEKTVGVCQKSAVEGELVLLDLTLVGFFLGKRPSFSFVKAALLRQWKIQGKVEIIQLPNGGYAFRFSDVRDRDIILDSDVCFVGGQPMFIRQWERNLHSGGILGLRKVPLWVSLPGLPLHLWGEEALSSICSVLGNPLYSDRTTAMKTRLMFARVCVEFTGEKPLLESITIEDELGITYEQKVTYDWKPPHCLTCGVFGHADCGVHESEKESARKKNEPIQDMEGKDKALTPDLNIASEKADQGTILSENMDGMLEEEQTVTPKEDDAWQQVRARKRGACGSGSGSTSSGQKRAVSQLFRPASNCGSKPHWMTLKRSDRQVHLFDFSKKQQENFKLKDTPPLVSCPLVGFDKEGVGGDSTTPTPRLTEPLRGIGPTISKVGLSESSAGHTPFPSRIVTMAKELRSRQNGRIGIPNMAVGFALTEGNKSGTENLPVDQPIPKDDLWDITRPHHTYEKLKSDSGTAGDGGNSHGIQATDKDMSGTGENSEDMIGARFEPKGGGISIMTQRNRSDGQEKSLGFSLQQNKPSSNGRETIRSNLDELQLETANGLINIEGDQRRTDLGLEMTDC